MKLERLDWTRIMQTTLIHEYTLVYTKNYCDPGFFKFRDSATINSRLGQEFFLLVQLIA
jgi:hypothetical protein